METAEDAPVYEVELDDDAVRSISRTVVTRIADLTGRDPTELEPLWDSVDPEALDSFVAHAGESSSSCRIAFEYEGYVVEVVGSRRLRLIAKREPLSSPMP
jgi:hypothetical protein